MLPTEQYATMILGLISPKNNTLSYAGAAAPPPIMACGKNPIIYSTLIQPGYRLG
ncbi:hypothetical protein [Kiloniella sp.]|uniref:hypothetical protein n=1 Tax=Kiloniella sp. TaxID=1938587 RepID=UPI003A946435